MDFVIKIEEVQAEEREDALFECVLTHPVPRVTWKSKASVLEDGDKYSISISDHKLVHRLLIKDCMLEDKSIYSAVVGKASCSAWLVVEGKALQCIDSTIVRGKLNSISHVCHLRCISPLS